jgi:hypothetical protein
MAATDREKKLARKVLAEQENVKADAEKLLGNLANMVSAADDSPGSSTGGGSASLAITPPTPFEGQEVVFSVTNWPGGPIAGATCAITMLPGPSNYSYLAQQDPTALENFIWDTDSVAPGPYIVTVTVPPAVGQKAGPPIVQRNVTVAPAPVSSADPLTIKLTRSAEEPTSDEALWVVIRQSTNALSFPTYVNFVDSIMCCPGSLTDCPPTKIQSGDQIKDPCALPPLSARRFLPFPNMDAYRVLKVATECFVMMNCGVFLTPSALNTLLSSASFDRTDDATRLNVGTADLPNQIVNSWWIPYLGDGKQYLNPADLTALKGELILPYLALVRARLPELQLQPFGNGLKCYGILQRKLTNPCLMELIWSYWMEEGMLVQALNVISRRFQNLRGAGERDPLQRLDLDPLRSLNGLFWGYVQDEQHRLSVMRRAYEYSHEYGLSLEGRAVRGLRPSDSRSKFLEAFHNLLYLCSIFFKEDDDTTVVADGFPILNGLKEIHYILAAGASNQFGDLPATARQEMLMQQWLLARPEMRDFLGGKIMVPYPEDWMDRVDTIKAMSGWTDVSVIYFRDLATYGEQIVLSIRYGAWSITNNPAQAANWARYWRPEIQAYIHAYRAATGVDLTLEPVNSTLPSVLLLKRLATQRPALTR